MSFDFKMSTMYSALVHLKNIIFCRIHNLETDVHKCNVVSEASSSFLPPLKSTASWFKRFKRGFKKRTLISLDNPQTAEYFRSKAEIFRARKDHVQSESWIIHPFSDFRAYYEMWMTVIWLLVIFYLPLDAAFDINTERTYTLLEVDKDKVLKAESEVFGTTLKMICLVDIVATFLTGYSIKKKRKVIMAPMKIAKNYVISIYFVTDLVASFPIEAFLSTYIKQRIFTTFGFVRIIRLPTLYFYMSRIIEIFGIKNFSVDMIKHIICNYLVFHWFACVQYTIPQIRFFSNGEILAESWIERTDLAEIPLLSKYITCIYRAVGCLFCIHFEAAPLEAWEEKIVAILIFIFGKVYIFFLTVIILNYLLAQRSLEVKYFETISQVQAYMTQKQLPMSMQTRLLQFYDYKYNKKFFKERGITSLLSEKLRGEINLSICSKLVQNVSLLVHLPQPLLEQLVINLKPEIYLANDIIIKAGSVGDCMYFLASGTVGVWTPSGKEVCHLQDGAYFGEISLVFKDKRRTANIIAVEICEVYKLDRKIFKNCFKQNTQLYQMLEDVAKERIEITQMFEDVHTKTFLEIGQ